MKVYSVNKETNEIINVFDNVLVWDSNSVLYQAGKGRCKIYAEENEYFTDKDPNEEK